MRNRLSVIVALVVLVAPGLALAQTQASTGQITGRVADSNGGLLPGVTVSVVNAAQGVLNLSYETLDILGLPQSRGNHAQLHSLVSSSSGQ